MKCRICNGKDTEQFFVRERMHLTNEEFSYRKCKYCGCVQIDEIPDNLSTYYEGYYSFHSDEDTIKRKIIRLVFPIASFFTELLSGVINLHGNAFGAVEHLHLDKSDSILDVGCGEGRLLRQLKMFGFTDLHGIDLYLPPKMELKEGNPIIKKGGYDSVQGKYKIVMMHHSFEHIPEPAECFRYMSELLEDDGTLLIRIPIIPNSVQSIYGLNWVHYDPPRHLHIFTIDAIKIMAEAAKMEIYDIVYDSDTFEYLASDLTERNLPFTDLNLKKKLKFFSPLTLLKVKYLTHKYNKTASAGSVAIYIRKKPANHSNKSINMV